MADKTEGFMTSTFEGVLKWSGGRQIMRKGQTFADDHPIVAERPDLFERAEAKVDVSFSDEPPVERGTRAPGERRESVDGRRRGRVA